MDVLHVDSQFSKLNYTRTKTQLSKLNLHTKKYAMLSKQSSQNAVYLLFQSKEIEEKMLSFK